MRTLATKQTAINQYNGFGNQLWDIAGTRPSLDLQFADRRDLVDATTGANLVDFTRASSGTYVDSEGVIRTATANLLLRSEEFDDAEWNLQNILAFGSGSTVNAIASPNGSVTADKVTEDTATGFHRIGQQFSHVAGATYTFTVFVKAAERTRIHLQLSSNLFRIALFDLATGTTTSPHATIINYGNDWYRCSLTSTASTTSNATVYVEITDDSGNRQYAGDGTSGIYIWGAQLEQSTTVGEYIPTTSTINSAPRFDHDPTTGESLGLLVEEQRSNLALQGERIDQSPWTLTLASVVAETSVLPNGGNSAYKLVPDAGSGAGLCRQNPTLADNTVYTISIFAKAAGFSQFFIQLFDKAGTFAQSRTIDLSTGGLSGSETGSSITSVVNYGNGWYRLILANVNSLSGATTPNVRFRIAETGDGTSGIYFWGAQLEAGSFPTSYIPTTGATATRAADVASIGGSNYSSWANNNEGTMFSDSSIIASQIQTQSVWQLSGGAVLSSLRQPHLTANQFRAVIGDTFTGSPGTGASLTTGVTFAAVAYSGTAGRLQVGSVGTDATGSALDATSLSIGSLAGSNQLNGRIKRLCFWPTRLADSTLQTITQ